MLIVGLGNPGNKYAKNRHNIGFIILDEIAKYFNLSWKEKFDSFVSSDNGLFFIKPLTYMNNSGIAVSKICQYYKIPISDVIVFHDDLETSLSQVKFKQGGGSHGHNGLRSITQHIGADYFRVRIGIGHPGANVTNFVLGNFSEDELIIMSNVSEKIVNNLNLIVDKNIESLQKILWD